MAGLNRWSTLSVVLLFSVCIPINVWAQTTPARTSSELRPGRMVWVTTTVGEATRGTVVSISATEIILRRAGNDIPLSWRSVRRIETHDPVSDGAARGALIGAAALVALMFVQPDQSAETGPRTGTAALAAIPGAGIGALIGVLVDASIDGRRTIYTANGERSAVAIAPIASTRRTGVGVVLRW